jgi:uncharacterized protein
MLLSIKEMEVKDLPFDRVLQPGEIDFSDYGITQKGTLKARGVAQLLPDTGDQVRIQGTVTADLDADCDRCLTPSSFHVDAPFDLFYKPAETAPTGDEESIDEGDTEIGFYEMPGLELEDILREQVLLKLPMQKLCRLDCKGLCPVCGGNRNEVDCHCETHPGDDRWIGLKDVPVH